MKQLPALIEGKPVATAAEVPVEDPSTGEVMAITADCGPDEIDRGRAAAAAAAVLAPGQRPRAGPAAAPAVRADRAGRRESWAGWRASRPASRCARACATPRSRCATSTSTPARSRPSTARRSRWTSAPPCSTRWEPHGVTAHIIPWNYPLQILGRSVAPALAMGNCAVLKPAEEAPLTALRIGELALEAGLPAGRAERRHRVRGIGRGRPDRAPGHRSHLVHRLGRGRADHQPRRRRPAHPGHDGARRQVAEHRVRRRRPRTGRCPSIVNSILQNARPDLLGGFAAAGRGERARPAWSTSSQSASPQVSIGPALDDPDLGPLISGPQRDRVTSYVAGRRRDGRIRVRRRRR